MTGAQTRAVEVLTQNTACEIAYVLFRPSVRMVDSAVFTRREDAQDVVDKSRCSDDICVAPIVIGRE